MTASKREASELFGVAPDQGREVVTFEKADKGGARAFSTPGRYKGLDEVIEVMLELLWRFPNLEYMIVGDGDDRARLVEKVKSLGRTDHFYRQKFRATLRRGVWYRVPRSSCVRYSGGR